MNGRIKEIRLDAGLNQTEFANRLNLTQNYLSLIENGKRTPSDRTITDLCREFSVNRAWLETGCGELHQDKTDQEKIAEFVGEALANESSDIRQRFLLALSKLDDDGWKAIAAIAESLSE